MRGGMYLEPVTFMWLQSRFARCLVARSGGVGSAVFLRLQRRAVAAIDGDGGLPR